MREKTAFRVGVFVLLGIVSVVLMVLILSQSRALFARSAKLYTELRDAAGLVIGSPVRLAGVNVGTVDDIEFHDNGEATRIRVTLQIEANSLERIREDSVAELSTRGLLGERIVNISLGSDAALPVEPGAFIPAREAPDISALVSKLERTMANVEALTLTVRDRFDLLLEEDAVRNVSRILGSTARILASIEDGRGLASRVLHDEKMAQEAAQILRKTSRAVSRFDATAQRLERILETVERGDGLLSALLYEESGRNTAKELNQVVTQLREMLKAVREGDGLAHNLIYGDESDGLLRDLEAVAEKLRFFVNYIDQGKGTIGGFLKDPSVYRELRRVLGEVRRNEILKAIVRFSIKNADLEPPERPK